MHYVFWAKLFNFIRNCEFLSSQIFGDILDFRNQEKARVVAKYEKNCITVSAFAYSNYVE